MSPTPYMVQTSDYTEEPISRTYQYRKVMKPMLERKRRARINRCLDELKELMVTALNNDGENVSKLEKADILELTVKHLHHLKRQHQLILPPTTTITTSTTTATATMSDRFRDGFTQCAQEVSYFLTTPSDFVDPCTGKKLLQHLGSCVQEFGYYQQQQQQQFDQREKIKTTTTAMWRPW